MLVILFSKEFINQTLKAMKNSKITSKGKNGVKISVPKKAGHSLVKKKKKRREREKKKEKTQKKAE